MNIRERLVVILFMLTFSGIISLFIWFDKESGISALKFFLVSNGVLFVIAIILYVFDFLFAWAEKGSK